jgi:hypothetical protein
LKPKVSNELLLGLNGEERGKYIQYLANNKELLDRLVRLLKKKLDASETAMRGREVYDKASWPHFHAGKLGEQRILANLISILTLDREE